MNSPLLAFAIGTVRAVVIAGAIFGTVLRVPIVGAQSPTAISSGAAFEVASIKGNKSGDMRTTVAFQPGGRFAATNVTLGLLIRNAYQLFGFQIAGRPSWLESDRFDIVAKADGDASPAQMQGMLRTLLSDRYKLRAHSETRELPIYALVIARSDGRYGPQLHRSQADCARALTPPPPPPNPNGPARCGFVGPTPGVALSSGQATSAFRGLTMDDFARFLARVLQRYVIDRTGLTGHFDGDFDNTVEFALPPPPPGVPDPYDRASFPSIFAALPDRLGLKLEAGKGPVDILVIDGVEKPTEN